MMEKAPETFETALEPLLSLPVARFKIRFQADPTWDFRGQEPRFRGLLGYRLRETCCAYTDFSKASCQACEFDSDCLYIALFAPTIERRPADPQKEKRLPVAAARPFVLAFQPLQDRTETHHPQSGEALVTLFGSAISYSTLFIESAAFALSSLPLRIESIAPDDAEIARPLHEWATSCLPQPPSDNTVSLRFLTPTRLTKAEKRVRDDISFFLVIQTAIRRLRDLKRAFHMDGDMGAFDSRFYNTAKSVVIRENRLRWKSHKRFSHRQKQGVHLDGFVGDIQYAGPVAPFLTLLGAAGIIHIGKGASSGNGRVAVNPADPQKRRAQ